MTAPATIWTFEALFVHMTAMFEERDRQVALALSSQEKLMAERLSGTDRATGTLSVATEKRFDAIADKFVQQNEFRGQLKDQADTLMPRAEHKVVVDALTARIDALHAEVYGINAREALNVGRAAGLSAGWKMLIGGLGAVVTILTIITLLTRN